MNDTNEIIVVGSAHRVGSTWLYSLLEDLVGLTPEELPAAIEETGTILLDHPDAPAFLNHLEGRWIFKAHSFAELNRFPKVKFISIYRDPRDVVVSTAFYMSWLPLEMGGLGSQYAAKPIRDRLLEIIHEEYFLLKLEEWFCSGAYQARYEDLIEDCERSLVGALERLGLHGESDAIRDAVRRNSFSEKSGRAIDQEDPNSFYRKGRVNDWRNYFDEGLIANFKSAFGGRWNTVLIAMGYESSANWSHHSERRD